MRNFLKHIDKNKKDIINKHVFLFLDFDGTLTPIRRHPDKVKLSKKNKDLLERIKLEEDISLAIISGRGLAKVKKMVGIKDIIYSGNHGFEIEGAKGIKFPKSFNASLKILKEIHKELKNKLKKYKGVIVEDKKATLSIHYRLALKKDLMSIQSDFFHILDKYIFDKKVRMTSGKKVWEIRPPVSCDKGVIVLELLKQKKIKKKILPFYLGDDVTDEDAFKALKGRGISIKIGKKNLKESHADYCLSNVTEVSEALRRILYLKREEK